MHALASADTGPTAASLIARAHAESPEMLVPWPALHAWIPRRVHWWIGQLMQGASQRSEPAYYAAPQWGEAALEVAH